MHCQANEYEIIARYLEHIGRLDKPTFIDIGAGDGYRLSNTRDLIERHGATGLLIDADNGGNPEVVQAFVTKENIVELCSSVPNPNFLSIDIDGNDFWILQELLVSRDWPYHGPSLIMAEVNTRFHSADESFTVPYDPSRTWNNDDHFGMSFGAFRRLMKTHGYTVVHMEGINATALRNDLVRPDTPISINYAYSFGHKPNTTAPWVAV
jgi:hypothetical protein